MSDLDVTLGADSSGAVDALHEFATQVEEIFGALANGSIKDLIGAVGELPAGFTVAAVAIGALGDLVIEAAGKINALAEKAEGINRLAIETGMAADEISRFEGAATLAGIGTDRFGMAFTHLATAMQDAINTSGKQRDAFEAVGLSVEKLKTMNMSEVISAISDAYANSADNAQKLAINNELFGGRMRELLPLLDKGSASLDAMGKSAHSALSKEDLGILTEFGEHWRSLKDGVDGFWNSIKVAGAETGNFMARLEGWIAHPIDAMTTALGEATTAMYQHGLAAAGVAPASAPAKPSLANLASKQQQQEIDVAAAKESMRLAEETFQFKKQLLGEELAEHKLTLAQKYNQESAYAGQVYAIELSALADLEKLYKDDPVKLAEVLAEKKALTQRHNNELALMHEKFLADQQKADNVATAKRVKAEEDLALEEARFEHETALIHAKTNAQKLEADQTYLDSVFDIHQAALEKQRTQLKGQSPQEQKAILDQMAANEKKYVDDSGINADKLASTWEGALKGALDSIRSSMDSIFTGLMNHTETLGGAVKSVFESIAKWAFDELTKVAEQTIKTAATQTTANAATAGSAATAASASTDPYGAVAIGVGVMLASLAAFKIASAEGGFDIPYGSNPLTQLHEGEMVLPKEHAETIRALGGQGGGEMHFHITAMDSHDVVRALGRNGALRKAIKQAQRGFSGA